MTTLELNVNIGSAYYPKNYGSAVQMDYDFMMTGKTRRHDSVPFDTDSDIPELEASIKSSAFTLVSAKYIKGDTMAEQWADFYSRVHSKKFVYISLKRVAYEMDIDEFKSFVFEWCGMEKESAKNGGGWKVRCKKESDKMLRWLNERVA